MNDPVYIQVSDGTDKSMDTSEPSLSSQTAPSQQANSYAVPDRLQQYMVVVPSKLRLVCLAAFILASCKVTTDMHAQSFFFFLNQNKFLNNNQSVKQVAVLVKSRLGSR